MEIEVESQYELYYFLTGIEAISEIQKYQELLKQAETEQNIRNQAICYGKIGEAMKHNDEWTQSITNLEKALELAQSIQDTRLYQIFNLLIGVSHAFLRDWEKAESYYKIGSESILEEDSILISYVYVLMGNLCLRNPNIPDEGVVSLYRTAVDQARQSGDGKVLTFALCQFSESQRGEVSSEAFQNLEESLQLADQINFQSYKIRIYWNLSQVYKKLEEPSKEDICLQKAQALASAGQCRYWESKCIMLNFFSKTWPQYNLGNITAQDAKKDITHGLQLFEQLYGHEDPSAVRIKSIIDEINEDLDPSN